MLIPGFFGRGPQFHWGLWPRVEVGYLGILPLILAGLALALRRDRRTWLWAGMAAASFLLALGTHAIVHGWLTLLPGFGQLRAPARLVLLTDFALAILAAIGLDATLRVFDERAHAAFERVWRWVGTATAAVWAVGVPLAYLALLLTQDREQGIISRISVTLIAVLAFAGLLAASFLWLSARRGEWAQLTTLGWLAAGLVFVDVASLAAYQDLRQSRSEPELRPASDHRVPRAAGRPVPHRHQDRHRARVAGGHGPPLRPGRHRRGGESAAPGRCGALLGRPGLPLVAALRSAQHPLCDRPQGRAAGSR